MTKCVLLASIFLLVASTFASAQGFQNEIQVFTQEVQKPGDLGLDLHLNSILQGPRNGAPAEATFVRAVNSTAELSLGLAPDLEAGLYLPVSWGANGHDLFAGPEVRLKWIPFSAQGDEDASGAFGGVNLSLARQNQAFSPTRTQAAVILIAGYQTPEWLLVVNPSFSWALSGDERQGTPEVGSSWKAAWRGMGEIQPGLEFYVDHGPLNRFAKARDQQQDLYATLDLNHRPWAFNVGLGRGLTPVSDRWTVKFVFEIPI